MTTAGAVTDASGDMLPIVPIGRAEFAEHLHYMWGHLEDSYLETEEWWPEEIETMSLHVADYCFDARHI